MHAFSVTQSWIIWKSSLELNPLYKPVSSRIIPKHYSPLSPTVMGNPADSPREESHSTAKNLLIHLIRKILITIFIRTTSFKLRFVNFNIFGSSEYKKDCTFFLKQLNFGLFKKLFLTINKKYRNHMEPNLSQVLSCTEEGMRVGGGGWG